MCLSLSTFQYFPHSLTKLSNFFVSLDVQTGSLQICSLRLEAKNQHRKHKKRMSDSLLQFFWKNDSRFWSSSSLMSFSFLVCFEWFKIWWVHWPRFYKTSLYLRGKDATIKDLKFEILIHLSPNIEPLTPNISCLPPLIYQIDQCFWSHWVKGYKCSFRFRSRGTSCEDSIFFEFLSVHSLAYLSYTIPNARDCMDTKLYNKLKHEFT